MRMLRTMLAVILALSVAFGPVGVTLAFAIDAGSHTTHGALAMHHERDAASETASMAGASDSGMADCDHVVPSSPKSGCHCCGKSSKCPDQASCLMKCCAKVLGTLKLLGRVTILRLVHVRPGDLLEPPGWTTAPPAPPPRT